MLKLEKDIEVIQFRGSDQKAFKKSRSNTTDKIKWKDNQTEAKRSNASNFKKYLDIIKQQ